MLLQTAEGVSDALVERLQTLTIAQGAETDIGSKVFRGRRLLDDDLIPAIVVIEGTDRVTEQRGLLIDNQQEYLLYAYLPCDPANPNVAAHAAIRDLKRAVFRTGGRPDWTWGGRIKQAHYRGKDIGPRADGAKFVLAVVDIAVEYVESLANP